MATINDVLHAIAGGITKINETTPLLAKASNDADEAASVLAQMNADGISAHMKSSAAKLVEAQQHLAAAVQAAGEASASALAAQNGSSGLLHAANPMPAAASISSAARPTGAAAPTAPRAASFGTSTSKNYKKTFFDKHPTTKGYVVVHHAVEQQTQKLYPGVVTDSEMHSYENLRGIPKGQINNRVHLSAIRMSWNDFYEDNPNPTKQQLLDHATKIDDEYGHQFNPPIR